ncbi:MAG: hypothetical protein QXR19_17970 [Candidatus Jordarchaeaceae archaeon]
MKPAIALVFVHRPQGEVAWPRLDFDYESRKGELSSKLRSSCPNVDFSVFTACSIEDAEKIAEHSQEFDGFLLHLVGQTTVIPAVILKKGKPTILSIDLYGGAGSFLLNFGWARDAGLPVIGLSTSNFEDITRAVSLFVVKKSLSDSKILLLTEKDSPKYKREVHTLYRKIFETTEYGSSGKTYDVQDQMEMVRKIFGTEVIRISYDEMFSYYEKASHKEAETVADGWIKEALRVIEPSREEIVQAAKMYLGIKRAMGEKGAVAITIDCYRMWHQLPAYPCMAFFALNNEGLIGICEGDLSSTIAQLLLYYLTKEITGEPRPGYVNDPIVDLAKNRIIYAHCLAPNKVFGPSGPKNPYMIRSHAESRKGVGVQSLLPTGEYLTAIQMHFTGESPVMVIHTGKALENLDAEEACRTKLAAETNAEKLVKNWNKGVEWVYPANWHRVVVYGDWKKDLLNLATLMKLKVLVEDEA